MFEGFPRPPRDNGCGLHCDGNAGDGPGTIGFMYDLISRMADQGFTWLKLLTDVNHKSGRLPLIEHARKKGIMVIARPFRQPCHPHGLNLYDDYIKAVVGAGCPYIEIGNEPNLAEVECWKPYPDYKYDGVTGRAAFISLLYDQWCSEGDKVKRLGGIPLFPGLSPTAYNSASVYFHHDLYTDIIGLGKLRKNLHWAFDKAGIAIHNRPGDGQPLDVLDRCAFRDYEWIEAAFEKALGRKIPLFGTEAGYEDGMVGDYLKHQHNNLYPNNQDYIDWHKTLNHEMFARFNPQHPKAWHDYLICECAWLAADDGWYASGGARNARVGGGPLPSFTDMHTISNFTRAEGSPYVPPIPEPEPPPSPEPQPPSDEIDFAGLSDEMIERLTLAGPENPNEPYWKIYRVEIQPNTDNMSAFAVLPPGADVVAQFWNGGQYHIKPKGDQYAPLGARVWAASMPEFAAWGSYGVRIVGNSEALHGFGLYGPNLELTYTAHRPTLVYFQLVQPDAPEPPEPPTPPKPGIPYRFILALDDRLVSAGLGKTVDMRVQIDNDYARQGEFGTGSLNEQDMWSITFHHTASTSPLNVLGIAKLHTLPEPAGRGFPHIGYHFIIGKDGTAWFTKKLDHYSAHCGNARLNKYSKSVAVHGDLTKESPTEAQLKALRCVVESLEEFVGGGWGQFHAIPIIRHKDIVDTKCPGDLYHDYRKRLLRL